MKYILDIILIEEVVYPVLIIFAGITIYMILVNSLKKILKLKINIIAERKRKTLYSLIKNILKYLIFIVCSLSILEVYGISTKGIIASIGIVGVVIGLALQDTLKDVLSGSTIIFENHYAIGDTIKIGDFTGKVISLGLKTTKIQAITGEIKIIANRNITEVVNYSLDNSAAILDIKIPYSEDIIVVEKIFSGLYDKIKKDIPNLLSIELLGIDEIDNSVITYKLLIKTISMEQFSIKREILKLIKIEFDKKGINVSYNQVVIRNA